MKATNQLQAILKQALNDLELSCAEEIHLEHPADSTHGDYATNIAMVLFGQNKNLKPTKNQAKENQNSKNSNIAQNKTLLNLNPRDLAQVICQQIEANLQDKSFISKIEIAGPGFINFTLSDVFLLSEMSLIIKNRATTFAQPKNKGKKAVVEYSSPNIAKPFTVGHLRSTIIGDALANLLEATGYEVYRDNHLGDWGTQFGKQIYALKNLGVGSLVGNIEVISTSQNPVEELVKLYIEFHNQADKKPELEDAAREWFKKLEDGDKEARDLWQMCVNWSWVEFDKIYQKLGIKFTENAGRGYGESYFENKMSSVIKELENYQAPAESEVGAMSIRYETGENGAKLVSFPEKSGLPPLMILKSDGATLYATRDLATDKWRLEEKYGQDVLIVNEVGAEQSLYFKQLFAIEKALGWVKVGQRIHVGHGLYRFQDKKMSTRKGNVIWLTDVLTEAVQRATKLADFKRQMDQASIEKVAFGALKWSDLKRNASQNVVFDWDEMMTMQGNSGPYVQYTGVRCQSILKKAENLSVNQPFDILVNLLIDSKIEITSSERDLLRNLYIYFEVVEKAASEYAPHHLVTYLFNLAQLFNKFYGERNVLASQGRTLHLRLAMVTATLEILNKGLGILGIEMVEKM